MGVKDGSDNRIPLPTKLKRFFPKYLIENLSRYHLIEAGRIAAVSIWYSYDRY